MVFHPFAQQSFDNNAYVVDIVPVAGHGIVASITDNSGASLHLLPFDPMVLKTNSGNIIEPFVKASTASNINAVCGIDENVVAICGDQGLKLYDLRTSSSAIHHFTLENRAEMLCLASNQNNQIAVGTQLINSDAGVVLWDVRTAKQSVAYIDSHSEDVTDISFHPHDNNALLSGSVDGLINIYNTSIIDEDEAVYQVINHSASIHKARFLPDNRVLALSHMETLSIYTLTNPDSDLPDCKPVEFGDIREKWSCEYVADLLPGYVGVGRNSENPDFKLIPFDVNSGAVDVENSIVLGGGHGEEVVRAVHVNYQSQCIYTGGEDGVVRVWRSGSDLPEPEQWKVEKSEVDEEGDVDMDGWNKVEKKDKKEKKEKDKKDKKEGEKKDKKDKKEKKERKEEDKKNKKDRKEKKDKKDKKDRKDKDNDEKKHKHRYQPY